MIEVFFITKNRHKVIEAQISIKQIGLGNFISLRPIDVPKLEIQSDDLREIATFAVRSAYEKLKRRGIVIVEDAGLFIDSLKGFPGPYSNYVYKTIGIEGVLKLLKNINNRRAKFISIIAMKHPKLGEKIFEGEVEGVIAYEAKGNRGFGFDPIFIPKGLDKTFAEMDIEEKCRYSHRGIAFRALALWLHQNLKTYNT